MQMQTLKQKLQTNLEQNQLKSKQYKTLAIKDEDSDDSKIKSKSFFSKSFNGK